MNIRTLNRIAARMDAFIERNNIECDAAPLIAIALAVMVACCIGGLC